MDENNDYKINMMVRRLENLEEKIDTLTVSLLENTHKSNSHIEQILELKKTKEELKNNITVLTKDLNQLSVGFGIVKWLVTITIGGIVTATIAAIISSIKLIAK